MRSDGNMERFTTIRQTTRQKQHEQLCLVPGSCNVKRPAARGHRLEEGEGEEGEGKEGEGKEGEDETPCLTRSVKTHSLIRPFDSASHSYCCCVFLT